MGLWNRLKEFHNGSVIAHLHDNDVDRIAYAKEQYGEAKIISDVIGFVLRMAFTMAAIGYFINKISHSNDGFMIGIYITCLVASSLLLGALNGRFTVMTHAYLLGRTRIPENFFGRFLFIFATLYLLVSINLGVFVLVKDISKKLIQ